MTSNDPLMKWVHVAGVVLGAGLLAVGIYFERYGMAAGMAAVFLINLAALVTAPQKP